MLSRITPSPGLDENALALSIMTIGTGRLAWFPKAVTIAVLAATSEDERVVELCIEDPYRSHLVLRLRHRRHARDDLLPVLAVMIIEIDLCVSNRL